MKANCAKFAPAMNRGWFLTLGVVALSAAANAQLSVSAGIYSAKSSAVRSVFGNNAFAFGFGLGSPDRSGRAGLGADFAGLSLNAPGNRFFTIGSTYGYEVQSGQGTNTLTYARAGAGLAYYDYSFTGTALGTSRARTFKPITTFEAGVVFSKQFSISAQYLAMPSLGGNDLSGFRVQATFSLSK
jgi:hypothetical protein